MPNSLQLFSITALQLNGHPLVSCAISFQIGRVPVCTVTPVLGRSQTGVVQGSKWLTELENGTPAEVTLQHLGGSLTLFKGRISAVQLDATAGAYQVTGKSSAVITLTHTMGDLDAISFGQREFIIGGMRKRFEPSYIDKSTGALTEESVVLTPALGDRKVAVHIREVMSELTSWYQHNTTGERINVRELLKASPVVMRDFQDKMEVIYGIQQTTVAAIKSGLGSGATVLGIVKGLADHCMLTLIPRLEDAVIVPNVPVTRKLGNVSFSDKYITAIWNGRRSAVLPTTRVCVHQIHPLQFSSIFTTTNETAYTPRLLETSNLGSMTYPPMSEDAKIDNILVSMPPPILKKVLAKALINRPAGVAPTEASMTSVAPPTTPRTASGTTVQATQDSVIVGEAAAKAIYCARAYGEQSASFFFAPGYVLGGGLQKDTAAIRRGWEDNSIWSFLGKVIAFESPYVAGNGLERQTLVGYVTGMSIELDRNVPSASVKVSLSHVRSDQQDKRHSLSVTDHPLFEKIVAVGDLE